MATSAPSPRRWAGYEGHGVEIPLLLWKNVPGLNSQPASLSGVPRGRARNAAKAVAVSVDPNPVVADQSYDPTRVAGYMDFDVSVTAVGDDAIVRIRGDLDCYSAPQLRSALVAAMDAGAKNVTLDIGGTQFVDSTGLSALVGGLRRLRSHGGNMVVASPTDATRRLFEITGLSSVFDIDRLNPPD